MNIVGYIILDDGFNEFELYSEQEIIDYAQSKLTGIDSIDSIDDAILYLADYCYETVFTITREENK